MRANRLIPLDVTHKILAAFGITEPTPAYERWVKPEGIDIHDFEMVLADSRFFFIIDWRAALPEELPPISKAVAELGTLLEIEVPEDADDGWIHCGSKRTRVKYVASENDDFTDVIRAIQDIIPKTIEFRCSTSNGGSDTWVFAVLSREEWLQLEALDAELVAALFKPLTSVECKKGNGSVKSYLITTGTIFGLMTLIHIWKIIAEWHTPDLELFIIVLITLLTTALSAWAFQLLRTQPPRSPAGFDVIRK